MAKLLQLRRGTTTQHASFTGAEGELTIDTTKDTAVIHDGSTQAGRPLLREDMANLPAGTIDNADVNASAAIAGTKISPDFGSQNVTTTGKVLFANVYTNESDLPSATTYHGMFAHVHSTGLGYYAHGGNWIKLAKLDAPDFTGGIDVTGAITSTGNIVTSSGYLEISGTQPQLRLNDTNNENDYELQNSDGTFAIRDIDASADRITIAADGTTRFKASTVIAEQGFNCQGNLIVSGTVDGRDVAADGTKLDGIESGATADQSAAEILTAIKTVDGSNSGLDADTLDGEQAGSFLRSNAADSAANVITFNAGAGAATIGTNSDIRFTSGGSWTGESTKIQHHNNTLYIGGGTSGLQFRATTGNSAATIDNSGNFTATGNVTAYSDVRLKTDISTINDALGICGKLRGVSYKWIATDKPSIGVIAQEVEEVIPEVVLTNRETNPSTGETTEIKSVDYGKIVGVLINAINELKAEVDELKKPKKKGGK